MKKDFKKERITGEKPEMRECSLVAAYKPE